MLNVSVPAGESFKDNIDNIEVERVYMDTARSFSYALLDTGKDAWLNKTDEKDAFKNMPARIQDLRLQGFKVFNKYFVVLLMIFGACTSLANNDILGNTIEKLVLAESSVPRKFVKRAVNDQPTATPPNSDWGEMFVSSYQRICRTWS